MAKQKETPNNEELKEITDDIPQIPDEETPEAGRDKPEVIKGKAVIESLKAEKPYSVRLWAGKIPVYVCNRCKIQRDSEEQMIMHAVKHYPKNQQNDVFDYLVKELGHE